MGKRWISCARNTRDDPSLRGTRPLLEPHPRGPVPPAEAAEIALRNSTAKFPVTAAGWMLDMNGVTPA